LLTVMTWLCAQESAGAQSLDLFGYLGVLGEWELTAKVTAIDAGQAGQLSGSVTMLHVGHCTQYGPEQKQGRIHLHLSKSSSQMRATLLVDGAECKYSAERSDFFSGVMQCPDRPD